jgi:eukaryotic-like serine/threonine-protein kinase
MSTGTSDEDDDRLGEVIGGRYSLLAVIGAGAQSVLYRAKDRIDGDEVAIKILRKGGADPDAVERLFREAFALTQLSGTSAVRVLHQLKTDDGDFCLVLELLRGGELAERLDELEAAKEFMPLADVRSIVAPIVRTLEVAHDRNIIHRDLKPQNIFLIHPAYGGGVRLLDFGFARQKLARPLTAPGVVAGSPAYLAPEVWRGGKDIDHRVDVYGLGVVLWRMIGGALPFTGGMYELMKAVTSGPRPSLRALRPELPADIDDWAECALASDRENRFQRVAALWNALFACLRDHW